MRRRTVLLALAAVAGVLVVALASLWVVQRDAILPNTSIAGVDVGGLPADEVPGVLAARVAAAGTDEVVLAFEDERFAFRPSEFAYAVDVDATVASALARGRGGTLRDVVTRVRSLFVPEDLRLEADWDRDALVAAIDDLADAVDRERSFGEVVADPSTLEVSTTPPHAGVTVRRDEALAAVEAAFDASGPREWKLPVGLTAIPLTDADVEAAASLLEDALSGPLDLHHEDDTLTVAPEQLAVLVQVAPLENRRGARLALEVTADRVDEVIGDAAREVFDRVPRDARYVVARTPPVSFDDAGSTSWSPVEADVEVQTGTDGRRFDPDAAARDLTRLVRAGAREGDLDVEVVEAELSEARAEELRPTHLLGTFTTYFTAGETRSHNIQLLADVIDGAIVLPGDQFSINAISGDRSCSKGYRPAGTIVAGELVDTCGGGTSQFGTTTFNAAFFAGVQLDQWQAHSYYIPRYPMGREATLTYPVLDVKFTNTTDGAIVVRTTHTGTSVTVSLYGRPSAREVHAGHGDPYDHRGAGQQVRNDASLLRGTERTVQSGIGGFSVDVVRTIDLLDGGEEREILTTVYTGRPRIVVRGTRDPPPPPPPPEERPPREGRAGRADDGPADDARTRRPLRDPDDA